MVFVFKAYFSILYFSVSIIYDLKKTELIDKIMVTISSITTIKPYKITISIVIFYFCSFLIYEYKNIMIVFGAVKLLLTYWLLTHTRVFLRFLVARNYFYYDWRTILLEHEKNA